MALSKERKLLLGALGSAGLILVADQVLLGPPQGANASQVAPAQPAQPTQTPTTQAPMAAERETAEMSRASGELVASWNEQLSEARPDSTDEAEISDPFSSAEQYAPDPSGVISPQEFRQGHKLTAVMTGGDIGVAMINGKPVRINQIVEGYRLISVDSRSAEFRAGDQTVRLILPQQIGGGS